VRPAGLNLRPQSPIRMSGIAKIYIQGELKRTDAEFYILLPALISAGYKKDDIVCVPFMSTSELNCESVFNIYDPFLPRGKLPLLDYKGPHLPLNDIVHVCSFVTILQNAAALDLPDETVILVLDARAIPRRDFDKLLKDLVGLPWECLSLAHHPQNLAEDASYFSESEIREHELTTPVTSRAVALRLSYVKKLVKTIMPFRESLDYELVFQTIIHKAKAQYVFPPIFDLRVTSSTEVKYSP
jgi:hypothetical protein